jgi:hypothetical protein
MLTLDWPSKDAYLARLFASHDARIDVDVLNLNEQVVGTARFLDGQIDLQDATNLVRRTASLTVSDPAGALDFSAASTWSGSSVWVDRLVRVRHTIQVETLDVTAVCFVGPPTQLSRSGAEVSLTCSDKAALAMRGSAPFTVKQGANAVDAIRLLLASCTGEFHFRFPTSPRRLSADYSVGWDDASAPMVVAARIAVVELGMRLTYASDGYALLRVVPQGSSLTIPGATEQASSTVDFTTLNNYVRVSGKATTKTSGKVTTKTQPLAIAQVAPASSISPASLARRGVPRYLPLVISDDSYTKTAQVSDRADTELASSDRLEASTQFSCVPFFHADSDDVVTVQVDGAYNAVRLTTGSIPLGTGGDMSIGTTRIVSRQPRHKSRVEVLRWRQYKTGPKKHRKVHWKRLPNA